MGAAEALIKEMKNATGELCGAVCDGDPSMTCLRAAGHAGATLMKDQHVGRQDDGSPVTFAAA